MTNAEYLELTRGYSCTCSSTNKSLTKHTTSCDLSEFSAIKRRKETVGKRTSEGYKPKPDEQVEVRGD